MFVLSVFTGLFHVTKKLLNLPSRSKIEFCNHASIIVSRWLFFTAFCLINMVVFFSKFYGGSLFKVLDDDIVLF